ncbi:hypothetical protein NDM229_006720 [Acinetobacter bereziniae]|nr:hypothetical protein NDM229_006720 [Acinetobacter bereziniae]
MIRVDVISAPTLTDLVHRVNSFILQCENDNPGFEVVSVSHSHPSETHKDFSALIAHKNRS